MKMLCKDEINNTNKTSKKIILSSSLPQYLRVPLLDKEEEQKDKKNF
jgi:hypothetical protein